MELVARDALRLSDTKLMFGICTRYNRKGATEKDQHQQTQANVRSVRIQRGKRLRTALEVEADRSLAIKVSFIRHIFIINQGKV